MCLSAGLQMYTDLKMTDEDFDLVWPYFYWLFSLRSTWKILPWSALVLVNGSRQ